MRSNPNTLAIMIVVKLLYFIFPVILMLVQNCRLNVLNICKILISDHVSDDNDDDDDDEDDDEF